MIRTLLAGALIGFADAAPMDAARLRRPLEVVWRDDRDRRDPLAGVPIMILDPVQVSRETGDRRGAAETVRLTLTRPLRLLRRLRARLSRD